MPKRVEYDIEHIKKNTNITHLLGPPVFSSPNHMFYKCPYHNEKTASFCWNTHEHYFKCFGCGQAGDIITLYQHLNNSSFLEAVQNLS